MKAEEALRFHNQVCFPLYAAANAVVRAYRPLLQDLDLTYLQYMTLMLLWEHKQMSVKALGQQMSLDSGTLTPLLKRLESKGLVSRARDTEDERVRLIAVTPAGMALRNKAKNIPGQLACSLGVDAAQAETIKHTCEQLLAVLADEQA
ncbi:MarR family transcriptional regulator [Seongchinamella unica]|uniref:MarR family transcriptional regulator n=1 Tax=Seongchinamella unica TaxID=2547392 RepID=A0A4R5LR85_9GAMM|nr:MarR family transcriptional regulator [Seongchinamella unica]TDG13378.1 MarR family transcriptional regulator [Seongchinamella unica]